MGIGLYTSLIGVVGATFIGATKKIKLQYGKKFFYVF